MDKGKLAYGANKINFFAGGIGKITFALNENISINPLYHRNSIFD